MTVHEEADVVHEEDNFIRGSDFKEGIFGLEGASGKAEIAFDIVGLILLFVGADDMSPIESHVRRQLVETELFRLLQLLCVWVHENYIPFFFLSNYRQPLKGALFLYFINREIMNLAIIHHTFWAMISALLKAESIIKSFSSLRANTEERA